jgi:hypothetical protein
MAKIVRPGTHVYIQMDDDRIRHARVIDVTDQNNISVRIGTAKTSASIVFDADKAASTKTRGFIYLED